MVKRCIFLLFFTKIFNKKIGYKTVFLFQKVMFLGVIMRKILTIILLITTFFSVLFAGCNNSATAGVGQVINQSQEGSLSGLKDLDFSSVSSKNNTLFYEEGVTYSDEIGTYDVDAMREIDPVYDKNIFYRNDIVALVADPFVLYCSDKTDTKNYFKILY